MELHTKTLRNRVYVSRVQGSKKPSQPDITTLPLDLVGVILQFVDSVSQVRQTCKRWYQAAERYFLPFSRRVEVRSDRLQILVREKGTEQVLLSHRWTLSVGFRICGIDHRGIPYVSFRHQGLHLVGLGKTGMETLLTLPEAEKGSFLVFPIAPLRRTVLFVWNRKTGDKKIMWWGEGVSPLERKLRDCLLPSGRIAGPEFYLTEDPPRCEVWKHELLREHGTFWWHVEPRPQERLVLHHRTHTGSRLCFAYTLAGYPSTLQRQFQTFDICACPFRSEVPFLSLPHRLRLVL